MSTQYATTVQLRGPDPHQLTEPSVQLDAVKLLRRSMIKMGERLGESRGTGIEVQPHSGRVGVMDVGLGCRHGQNLESNRAWLKVQSDGEITGHSSYVVQPGRTSRVS
jgi:hypothetical protein